MTSVEWFTLVIAVATSVYTVATWLLWRATLDTANKTQQSVNLARESLESTKKSVYGLTLQGIAQNNREIAFKALESEKLQQAFMAPNPEDRELDAEARLFSMALINHLETCFEHTRFGTIPEEFKAPLLHDISSTFVRIPAMRRRWEEVADQLEPEFVKFVDQELEKQGLGRRGKK